MLGGDGMGAEVRVEPALLEQAQQVCAELRAEVTRDEHDVEGATQDAWRGLAGWGTQRALEDLLWWWRDDAAKLGKYLTTFGTALHDTASDYRASDHASADLFDIRGR